MCPLSLTDILLQNEEMYKICPKNENRFHNTKLNWFISILILTGYS